VPGAGTYLEPLTRKASEDTHRYPGNIQHLPRFNAPAGRSRDINVFSIQKKKGEGFIPVLGGILKLAWLRHAQCCCQQLANHLLLTFPV